MPDPLLDVAALREEYLSVPFLEADAAADPITQLRRWLDEALEAGIPEPNAMVLSTADGDGAPSSRTVLLKGIDELGLTFFTNRHSRKGHDLAVNPRGSLTFPWIAMRRQVHARGPVTQVSDAESDAYFATRPRGSQLAAWASDQSESVDGPQTLQTRVTQMREHFGDGAIPRPPHWGGYRLEPEEVEFWQGRPDRLHDRLRYTRTTTGWTLGRLWP